MWQRFNLTELINTLASVIAIAQASRWVYKWLKIHPLDRQLIKKFERWAVSPLVAVEGMVHFSITPKGIGSGLVELYRIITLVVFIMLATIGLVEHEVFTLRAVLTFLNYIACGFGMFLNIAFIATQDTSKLPKIILWVLIAVICAGTLKLLY